MTTGRAWGQKIPGGDTGKCGKPKHLLPPFPLSLALGITQNGPGRNARDMTTASGRSQESDGIRPFTFSKLVGLSDRCYRSTAVGQTVYCSVQTGLHTTGGASVLVMFLVL